MSQNVRKAGYDTYVSLFSVKKLQSLRRDTVLCSANWERRMWWAKVNVFPFLTFPFLLVSVSLSPSYLFFSLSTTPRSSPRCVAILIFCGVYWFVLSTIHSLSNVTSLYSSPLRQEYRKVFVKVSQCQAIGNLTKLFKFYEMQERMMTKIHFKNKGTIIHMLREVICDIYN